MKSNSHTGISRVLPVGSGETRNQKLESGNWKLETRNWKSESRNQKLRIEKTKTHPLHETTAQRAGHPAEESKARPLQTENGAIGLSHLRIEEGAPGGQTQERSLSGPSQNLDCVARLLAKRVETVIPQQVNSVARPRTLEPFLCGKIQRVGRIGEAGVAGETCNLLSLMSFRVRRFLRFMLSTSKAFYGP